MFLFTLKNLFCGIWLVCVSNTKKEDLQDYGITYIYSSIGSSRICKFSINLAVSSVPKERFLCDYYSQGFVFWKILWPSLSRIIAGWLCLDKTCLEKQYYLDWPIYLFECPARFIFPLTGKVMVLIIFSIEKTSPNNVMLYYQLFQVQKVLTFHVNFIDKGLQVK